MKNKKKLLNTIINVILWIFLAFALLVVILAISSNFSGKDYPVFGNTCMLTVQSDSMNGEGGFKKGDIIFGQVLTTAEKENLQVGDIITFKCDLNDDGINEFNTHKIIAVNEVTDSDFVNYTTKGINPLIAEDDTQTVYSYDVEAKWNGNKISGLGTALDFLQSSTGFLVCIVIPMGVLFLYELIMFVLTLSKYKSNKQLQENGSSFSKEEEELIKQKAIEEYLAKQNANKEEK